MSKRNAVKKDELQRELSQLLRQVIYDRRWSQAAFARQIEVSPGLLSHWLAGDYSPSAEMLSQIIEKELLTPDEKVKLLDIWFKKLGFGQVLAAKLLGGMLPSASHVSYDAELYIKLSKTEEVIQEPFHSSVLLLDLSKRFWTRIGKKPRIIVWPFEEQAVQSVKGAERPILAWSTRLLTEHKQYWPKHIPFLEVTGLWIDRRDMKGSLIARTGTQGEHIFECELEDGDGGLRDVRVDVRTFSLNTQDDRCAHEIYLPEAGQVRLRFDASSAGFNKAWIESHKFIDEPRPFVAGPEGEGTVEAVLGRPERGQHVTIVAVKRQGA